MLSIAPIIIIALVSVYIFRNVKTYLELRDFGGPWSAGWTRLWLLRCHLSGSIHTKFTEINNKHGSTARVAPKMLVTSDHELVRRMNAIRSPFTRGPWYTCLKLHPESENIACYTDEDKHNDMRSRMSHGYSGKENVHLEQDIDDLIIQMLDLIEKEYVAKPENGLFRRMDLAKVTSYFTLDIISKVAFGEPFGFLAANDDPFGYAANLKQILPAIGWFGVYHELTNILRIPFIKSSLPSSMDKRGLGRVMGFARERILERFGDEAIVRQDMLNSFIKNGLTQLELEGETMLQISAGSDSTASALRIITHFISTSPPILERLLTEVDEAIVAGRISRPVIKNSEALQLPYLQACIKEGLRVYPPITGMLAKMVPKGGAKIDVDGVEKYAPSGTQIAWNSWGLMRNTEIFGPDADIFRPERWLASDNIVEMREHRLKMEETLSLVFGYGRFGCLGKMVANMELNKALIEVCVNAFAVENAAD
ncbi:putative P450 monooxygenase [Karstenula rhodostoma CBS 690.94]|uniref:P450 monooxygenase n=1 Tax=Karstenula rhodostoma CBS 690.94 TaxID=1392251 RepID=A0A9P4PFV7_9PLEO|nr:putative P450 monooxygenase [Karstenula rhodostoma CBS 690.94]